MKLAYWLGALAFAVAVPAAHAETVYVIEQLVVGVNSAPDESGERIGSIHSGDKVELLERQDEQAHIRLQNGSEGWVKASYLSSELPMQQRLEARTAEVTKLKSQITKLESEMATVRLAATAPAPAPAPAAPVATRDANPDAAPAAASRPLFRGESRIKTSPPWRWVFGASAASLLIGFVFGWRMLDRRIRAKYGGLRIY